MPPKTSVSTNLSTTRGAGAASNAAVRSGRRQLVPSTAQSNNSNSARVAQRSGTSTSLPRSSTAVAPAGQRTYGEVIESDEVHDEIRALGTEVKTMLAQHLPRHGTSEEQVTWGVRQFGPSKESRKVLNKENEAAKLAWERGVYCVWRCTEVPKLRGANNDFCCRLGYRHVCFCGHRMAAHTTPACATNASLASAQRHPNNTSGSCGGPLVSDRQLAQWKSPCEEAGCPCASFRYVPNTPLEIGEGWLTRRANFKASEWSAKCQCGHGHKAHDPSSYLRCRSCAGCPGFTSAFRCVVCDLSWEAHATVWESEGSRQAAHLPVREAYAPLADMDWDVRELVLQDVTMGGRIEPPARYEALQDRHGVSSVSAPSPSSLPRICGGGGGGGATVTAGPAHTSAGADPVLDVVYCPACATVYRSAASNFCTKCGQPRPRRPTTLR